MDKRSGGRPPVLPASFWGGPSWKKSPSSNNFSYKSISTAVGVEEVVESFRDGEGGFDRGVGVGVGVGRRWKLEEKDDVVALEEGSLKGVWTTFLAPLDPMGSGFDGTEDEAVVGRRWRGWAIASLLVGLWSFSARVPSTPMGPSLEAVSVEDPFGVSSRRRRKGSGLPSGERLKATFSSSLVKEMRGVVEVEVEVGRAVLRGTADSVERSKDEECIKGVLAVVPPAPTRPSPSASSSAFPFSVGVGDGKWRSPPFFGDNGGVALFRGTLLPPPRPPPLFPLCRFFSFSNPFFSFFPLRLSTACDPAEWNGGWGEAVGWRPTSIRGV